MAKTKKTGWIKRAFVAITVTLFLVFGILLFANWKIPHDTRDYIFDEVENVPERKAALVLGAAKNLKSGRPNLYFKYRMEAAKELYDAGKVSAFVLSGDNSRKSYNEPQDMHDALVESGIPDSIIYLDYAGFRTLDSVVRMKEIFGQDSFIVVSQKFHNERAVFLAQHYGLRADGYNAKDVALMRSSLKTKVREKFARVKVFVDMILGKEPKFLGEPIEIK